MEPVENQAVPGRLFKSNATLETVPSLAVPFTVH